MKVRFSDGLVCRTSVPLTGGQGQLKGCANPLSWSITIQKRNPLEQVFGEAVSPYAMIVLSDGGGAELDFRDAGTRRARRSQVGRVPGRACGKAVAPL
jgi:hypothetical protein